ncbi:hypothetical protein TREMEDRAFT_73151 [Tremella mesenterica DSM 1558]|uniref:uncharacterized protein n=1 Tax=Tremella mesenterica (strain ATCC 24925 / CBS 8224 / DSM 1558 / NBRC 9311 / NRRL Y-6157 / RJB 2259-6 / UBC 559-6) TaxID=578456 RepID=UPI0003F4A13F|nr:uncharacterized protein TREMEDRAFT_73151 [Tremella mesenterica DSM 1558]EIW70968.1 hypothetical protein TREMEDRAFT_73151 [Tremella mesenterica DSM 1558]
MSEIIYLDDKRYPGPETFPAPSYVKGIPTQEELDSLPRMFTWGELKDFIKDGSLELLGRNYSLQKRYDRWMTGIKREYGSTEKYLSTTRLPWSSFTQTTTSPSQSPQPPGSTPSNPDNLTGRSAPVSGTSTPSAGFVSLSSLSNKRKRHERSLKRQSSTPVSGDDQAVTNGFGSSQFQNAFTKMDEKSTGSSVGSGEDDDDDDEEEAEYLRYDHEKGLDRTKYACLINDWPYNIPYGVRHYCVWSKVPIAHPELVNYDPTLWARIEFCGLSGFTGVLDHPPPSAGGGTPTSGISPTPPEGQPSPSSVDPAITGDSPVEVSQTSSSPAIPTTFPLGHSSVQVNDPSKINGNPGHNSVNVEDSMKIHGNNDHTSVNVNAPMKINGNSVHTSIEIDNPLQTNGNSTSSIEHKTTNGSNHTPPGIANQSSDPNGEIQIQKNGGEELSGLVKLRLESEKEDLKVPPSVERLAGPEMRKWAGVTYESPGGKEVGNMVRGLWDERGWECLWFVNPPHLQSVPTLSHFHIFARRKTPEEIDAAEEVLGRG